MENFKGPLGFTEKSFRRLSALDVLEFVAHAEVYFWYSCQHLRREQAILAQMLRSCAVLFRNFIEEL